MKINAKRGGFTLVEIMIVVAIIALLASIAVPNFMRARTRSQATSVKLDIKQIDAAIDQWAMEKNQANGVDVVTKELAAYIKKGTPLYAGLDGGAPKDTYGSDFAVPFKVGTLPAVPAATRAALSDVIEDSFWSPYN